MTVHGMGMLLALRRLRFNKVNTDLVDGAEIRTGDWGMGESKGECGWMGEGQADIHGLEVDRLGEANAGAVYCEDPLEEADMECEWVVSMEMPSP